MPRHRPGEATGARHADARRPKRRLACQRFFRTRLHQSCGVENDIADLDEEAAQLRAEDDDLEDQITDQAEATIERFLHGEAGKHRASLTAIDRAEGSLTLSHEVPVWMDYYDMTRLQGFKGFAYLKAGKPEEARTALGEAVSGLDGHALKQRAVFLTDLATSYVPEGEVHQGAQVAAEAADALSTAGYATSADRLHEFRALVQPWHDRAGTVASGDHCHRRPPPEL